MVVIATAAWGFDDQAPPDLSDVFASRPPRDLLDNEWAVLDGNWEAWSLETADAVAAFYDAEDYDSRKAALDRLHVKLNTMEVCLADSKYAMIHDALAEMHGRLNRRVEVADAVFEMTDLGAARDGRIRRAYGAVTNALDSLRDDLGGVPGGSAWLPYAKADLVSAIASNGDTGADAQAMLAAAHSNLVRREGLNPEQAEFLSRESFGEVAAALEGAIEALNWAPAEGYREQLIEQLAQLLDAVEEYEEDGGSELAAAVRSHSNAVRQLAGGPSAMSRAIRRNYMSFNMRVIASEGLMTRFAGETRSEMGTINEPINEAWVSGRSCTVTNVSIDLRPNDDVAQMHIVLNGSVNATTTANASQAVVYGGSRGTFHAEKPIYFDGHEFNLDPARVSARVSTYSNDVDAKVFFLLRPIADHIAEGEVARRKPQSDATARSRVVRQVSEELNTETDQRFADAEAKLEADIYGPLRELGWYPQGLRLSTTDDELLVRARLMEPGELGASAPSLTPDVPSEGIVIQVHESGLNNITARMDVAGRTMTGDDLKAELEERLKKLFGEEFELGGSSDEEAPAEEPAEPAEENVFVFDTVDPMRFEIGEGAISVVLRTGLKREGEEDIDTHILTIPLSFRVEGDQIVTERIGNVRVVPAPGVARNIPQQGIMRRNIEDAITTRTMDSELKLEQEGKTVTLNISNIQANDGWVTVTAE